MKMFLASTLSCVFDLFLTKIGSIGKRVLFIDNPSDPFDEKPWVNKDKNSFLNNGFKITEIDLRDSCNSEFESLIKNNDILHVCGGSVIYFINLLRRKKIDLVFKNSVKDGKIVYSGTSAGSVIMASNISFCMDDEDEQEAGMVGRLKNHSGLGLAPFYMVCHTQDRYYMPSTKKSIDRLPRNKTPILFFTDSMAAWIDGDKVEFLNK